MSVQKLKIEVKDNKVINSTYKTWYDLILKLFPDTIKTATLKVSIAKNIDEVDLLSIEYKDDNNKGTMLDIPNNIIGAIHKDTSGNDLIKDTYNMLKENNSRINIATEVIYD